MFNNALNKHESQILIKVCHKKCSITDNFMQCKDVQTTGIITSSSMQTNFVPPNTSCENDFV